MKTPKKIDYEKEYKESAIPHLSDFKGRFEVKILTGISKMPEKFSEDWEKEIQANFGVNIITWNEKSTQHTGMFIVRAHKNYVFLDYTQHEYNFFPWNRMQDRMKMVNKDKFIGKIYFKFWGKFRFLGYFYLLRQEGRDLCDHLTLRKEI